MAVLLRDRNLRPQGVAGFLIALMLFPLVFQLGCQGGPMVRGQSPELTSPPRLLSTGVSDSSDSSDSSDTIAERPVTAVQIEGNESISDGDIRRLLRVQAGRNVTETQVREDVRRLFATRWFFSVEPIYRADPMKPGGRLLVYRLVERPMIRAIRYDGNSRLDDDELSEASGLRVGSPFDISANREALRRLEAFYSDKGFPFAKLKLVTGGERGDRDVVFGIVEGQKVVVFGDKTCFLWVPAVRSDGVDPRLADLDHVEVTKLVPRRHMPGR